MDDSSTSQSTSEWTSEELRILFHCINLRGAHEGSIDYICSRIETRSEAEIRDKIDEIRQLVKKKNERKQKEDEKRWCTNETILCNDSKVQTWLDAVSSVQSHRKISDYTCQALAAHFSDEIKKNSNDISKKQLLCTDCEGFLCSGQREDVDVANFYRFLHCAVNASRLKIDISSLEAAILMTLYQDIQQEVNDLKLEMQWKILKGIFKEIQGNEVADFDFRYCHGIDDSVTVQLNPLNLTERQLDVNNLYGSENSTAGESV